MASVQALGHLRLETSDVFHKRSLKRISRTAQANRAVIYRSAIAFSLANALETSPLEIAQQLAAQFTTASSPADDDPLLINCTLTAIAPGWLDFRLHEPAIALWLQRLLVALLPANPNQPLPNPTPCCFPIQYTHARCYSLLQLAHRQGIIQLHERAGDLHSWQWLAPDPIPWLSGESSLCLTHRAEQHLIEQLLAVFDELALSEQPNGMKLAVNLSEAVLDFHRQCRIWGEVLAQTPNLAQARLGLIAVTCASLQWLLATQLGISALTDL